MKETLIIVDDLEEETTEKQKEKVRKWFKTVIESVPQKNDWKILIFSSKEKV